MEITSSKTGDCTTIKLKGRLDTTTAPTLSQELNGIEEDVAHLILDLEQVEYVSSAGLRVFLAAQKKMNQQGDMKVTQVSKDVLDVFEMTGFSDLLTIEPKLREISIDGCERIGAGMCGECYKLDDETVVKLYFETTSEGEAEREKLFAKTAFLLGIPTAISYDTVMCGKRKGLVFEMIHARTLASVIHDDMENMEQYAEMFANLSRTVHEAECEHEVYPDCKNYYEEMVPYMTWADEQEIAALKKLVTELPDAKTCVHGDYHTGNVMYQDGELMFIDMGDMGVGHPYFDVAQVYNLCTRDYKNDLGGTIMKMNREERLQFWKYYVKYYFGVEDDVRREDIEAEVRRFDAVRTMFFIKMYEATREENVAFIKSVLAEQNKA